MPYLNGVRVTNEEWIAATTGPAQGWAEATGYKFSEDAPVEEPVAEEPPKRKRGAGKKAEVEAIVADVTGLDITLDDDVDFADIEGDNADGEDESL